jgi:hypothetical protein
MCCLLRLSVSVGAIDIGRHRGDHRTRHFFDAVSGGMANIHSRLLCFCVCVFSYVDLKWDDLNHFDH